MSILTKMIRIGFIIIFLVILVFLIDKNFAVRGVLNLKKDFSKYSFLIDDFLPKNRVNEIARESGDYYQELLDEPIYFQINLPAYFLNADLEFEYQNPSQNIVEIGVEKAEGIFEFKPLENKILDNLTWTILSDGNITLWQREKKFETISDFLNSSLDQEIVKYRFDLKNKFVAKDYVPLKSKKSYQLSVKDDLRMFTYVQNEPMALDFYFDLPESPDENNYFGKIILKDYYYGQEVLNKDIYYKDLEELIEKNSARYRLLENSLNNGVYEIQIILAPDKKITRFASGQRYLVFKNSLHISESENQTNKFYSDSVEYRLWTNDMNNLPTLQVAEQVLEVNEIYKQTRLVKPTFDLKQVKLEGKDVQLYFDESLSLDQESYFNPFIKELKPYWQINLMPIDYIIANYKPERIPNDYLWQTRNLSFDLSNAYYREKDGYKTLRFIVSAPGLADNNPVKIKNIKVNLSKDPISIEKIKNKLFK